MGQLSIISLFFYIFGYVQHSTYTLISCQLSEVLPIDGGIECYSRLKVQDVVWGVERVWHGRSVIYVYLWEFLRQSVNNNIPFIVFVVKMLKEFFNLVLINQLRGILETFLEPFQHVFRE